MKNKLLLLSIGLAGIILGSYCSDKKDKEATLTQEQLRILQVFGIHDSFEKNKFDPIYSTCKYSFSYPCSELAEEYRKAWDNSMIKYSHDKIVEELSKAKDPYAKDVLEKQHAEFVEQHPNCDKPYREQLSREDRERLGTVRYAMLSRLHFSKVNSAAEKMAKIFDQ